MKEVLGARIDSAILSVVGASEIQGVREIQELWSGYGRILKISVNGKNGCDSIVVKHVRFPDDSNHPRGWSGDISHERKARSYEVEAEWYRTWRSQCDDSCRVPRFLGEDREGEEWLLVMEDLDAAGFPRRIQSALRKHVDLGLRWLAEFHATFLGQDPGDLWLEGTYWHLATRPEELVALEDETLKEAARKIDARLSGANYQTLVHGDAKLANFCFSENGDEIAAVDFQYVGGGCGMKDVAYFIGSCLDEAASESLEEDLLDRYFEFLREAILRREVDVDPEEVVSEWRNLYHFAWADFHRFLKGWCPGHWKINSYSEKLVRKVIGELSLIGLNVVEKDGGGGGDVE